MSAPDPRWSDIGAAAGSGIGGGCLGCFLIFLGPPLLIVGAIVLWAVADALGLA